MSKGVAACLALAMLLLACRRPPVSANVSPAPSTTAPALPCPIVPISLVMVPEKGNERPVLSLNADGRLDVDVATTSRKHGAATLDPQGCLFADDGLWAELAPHDKLWTPHTTLEVDGACLVMNAASSLCLAPDGKIERHIPRADGAATVDTSMEIRGYRPEARCAGLLLLATFASMMPSMAVVDGHPARAPAPEGSRCGAYRRP